MSYSFGEKLRILREKKELTQTQLGNELCMTQRKISYLERDIYEPSMRDIYEICRFFGVSADFMLSIPNK